MLGPLGADGDIATMGLQEGKVTENLEYRPPKKHKVSNAPHAAADYRIGHEYSAKGEGGGRRSGEEALEKIINDVELVNRNQRCSYNLIFMDCQMPYMDGYETSMKIREYVYNQRLPQPIISAVTGHTEQEYINKAIESGMNQVLTKPVKLDILTNIVLRLGYRIV